MSKSTAINSSVEAALASAAVRRSAVYRLLLLSDFPGRPDTSPEEVARASEQ